MKKNLFSDDRKGSKGFYTALGLSAVMIGSACYFAYGQSEKFAEQGAVKNAQTVQEAPVNKRAENVPKETAAVRRTAPPVTTMAAVTVTYMPKTAATLPAASITVETSPAAEANAAAEEEVPAEPAAAAKLDNPRAPLADMSNIIAVFSNGELVKNSSTGAWQTHNGTDIGAEVGSDVYAVSSGEVAAVENDPVWGVTVVLNHHNGYITRYCGLSAGLSVQQGDKLVSGDVIGTVGDTADIESALPPHLHIEMMKSGSFIDPLSELE